ncbi:carboxylesterase/lipase family protein [Sphingosinicella sp.]|uniref:carboxylesterase/lipase family protein n=1 Tax=Sphingosinicella sp. TaxID=1917971 RepID=UPI0040378871
MSRRAFIGAAAGFAAAPAWATRTPVVETGAGRVRGTIEDGVARFLGVRYGHAARFQAAAPPPPTRGTIDAFAFGPSSPQSGLNDLTKSEDCLFLNIWTPAADRRARLPVMVYFHGGAYSSGTASSPLLDGRHLAAHGAVIVTVQHRLNAFGYLYLARLDPRFPDSGNAGQLDLILALQWVRDNIAAFGGDPARVTVFGQSGGGAKIATLMGTPAAAGLFHRAATMSGQQVTVSGPLNATRRARAYLDRLGSASIDTLLALPAERLVEGLAATDPILGGSVYFGPVLDMTWLTRHPFWPDANPQSNAIPLVLGNTHDETRAFYAPDHRLIAGLDWSNVADRIGPELRIDVHPEWVVAEYRRLFPDYSAEQVFFAATTAGRSWRAQLIEAEERARAGAPAFVYQLDFPRPAPHAADIPLVFGTFADPAARAVSEAMMTAFLCFAQTGDPGWPAYALPQRRTMLFDLPPRLEDDPRRAERELFARIPYLQPGT